MLFAVKHYLKYFYVLFLTALLINISTLAQNKSSSPTNFPEPIFEHLTIADGLPENSVRCILQDHLGYLWLGTQNGLVRYDGYNMKVYQPVPDDSLSISHRQIYSIYEDKSGNLWVGTRGGLNCFNRSTDTFTRYIHNPDDSTSINSNWIWNINGDKEGRLFIGTENGLNLFDQQTNSFKRIYTQESIHIKAFIEDTITGNFYVAVNNNIMRYDPENEVLKMSDITLSNPQLGTVNSFCQAADGTIWIGHSRGLSKFNPQKNSVKLYQVVSTDIYNPANEIYNLIEDNNGIIWGSNSYSFGSFDPRSEKFKGYEHDPSKPNSISSNNVWSVYKDRSGIIWVGTGWAGLNKWNRNKYKFKRFSFDPNNPDDGKFNRVFSIIEDSEGIIWFGTNNGLNSYDRSSGNFRIYKYDTKGKDNTVTHICKDGSSIIWLGTLTRGLVRLDRASNTYSFYSKDPNDSTSISDDYVRFILPDENDILWIGTWAGGLNRFDKKTGVFTRYIPDSNNSRSLSNQKVSFILRDRNETVWVGTDGQTGLNRYEKADDFFTSFGFLDASGSVNTIYEDHNDNFWVGSYVNGIYLIDRDKGIPNYKINEKDGLANNTVRSIIEDDSGNLWISTNNGLSRIDPQTRTIKNYYTSEIFEENSYSKNSVYRTSTGEMLLGTYDGFIMFHPDSIEDDPVPPQVVINNVSLFNRPGEKLTFDGFISELKELDLSYDEKDLRFDYVGLHFGEPEKNQYKYMLENFDDDWIDAGTQRNATYTNLDAGEYVFRITASNRDGVWNEKVTSLKIIIPPPFWATWWAYSIYALFALGLLYSIRRYEMNRTKLKNQVKLDEVKLKEREEMDKMKSRFFANISHEFRTPLTLIKGPAEKINRNSSGEEIEKQTGVIKRNTNRLLVLINQLLDLSKLEAGKLELKTSKANIVSFIKGITMSFESVAEGKDITLKVKSSNDEIDLYFDKEKMTKIMTNLLSNAFKFTQKSGQITVSISESNTNSVGIKIRDTGVGIPEEEIPKLFDRFYQVDSSQTREQEGTGIGLALTKELVELHKGTITVNSKLGEGTEFTIELPVGRRHLKDAEIVEEKTLILIPPEREKNLMEINATDSSSFDRLRMTDRGGETNDDKEDSLGGNFQIEEASNGEQGVRKAENIIPDLIISDIMMPKMDGNELTRTLKNDEKTSHIPIILLTARSEQESKLEGLETGADDYLTKPFDTKELQIRIKNLINIRRELQKKYSQRDYSPIKKEEEKKLSNLEEQFMHKVMEVIDGHISEEDFSIEQFGKEVGMSRVQLHRKLKALSGKSTSSYLRSVRLSKAKKMITEEKGNISEIAYSVGFSSPAYFTRCFKEEYGYPPSDVMEHKGK
jgi:signal transduction histidine kinase/ligand-binding sensor domain-containing protein/CheY-like chemotaxis protein